ncbi:MAG: hypothetical protein V7752_11830 [Halopseudomonas sp.]
MTDNYQQIAAQREAECAERAVFFDSRLRFFSKTNWITVLVPSLLGVVAGSALFAPSSSVWMGVGVLLAALLAAVHKGLDCDAHQTECRRLVQAYRGLEVRYRTLHQIETATIVDQLLALDNTLAELRESQNATVDPQWLKRWLYR